MGVEDVKKSAAGQLGSEQNLLSVRKQYWSVLLVLLSQKKEKKINPYTGKHFKRVSKSY